MALSCKCWKKSQASPTGYRPKHSPKFTTYKLSNSQRLMGDFIPFVCQIFQQDYTKATKLNLTKLDGEGECVQSKNSLQFGADPDYFLSNCEKGHWPWQRMHPPNVLLVAFWCCYSASPFCSLSCIRAPVEGKELAEKLRTNKSKKTGFVRHNFMCMIFIFKCSGLFWHKWLLNWLKGKHQTGFGKWMWTTQEFQNLEVQSHKKIYIQK